MSIFDFVTITSDVMPEPLDRSGLVGRPIPSSLAVDFENHFRQNAHTSNGVTVRGLRIDLVGIRWSPSGIAIRMTVPDRDTGEPILLQFNEEWPPTENAEQLAANIHRAISNVVAHEVQEMILVHGVRRDPHE